MRTELLINPQSLLTGEEYLLLSSMPRIFFMISTGASWCNCCAKMGWLVLLQAHVHPAAKHPMEQQKRGGSLLFTPEHPHLMPSAPKRGWWTYIHHRPAEMLFTDLQAVEVLNTTGQSLSVYWDGSDFPESPDSWRHLVTWVAQFPF